MAKQIICTLYDTISSLFVNLTFLSICTVKLFIREQTGTLPRGSFLTHF